MLESSTSEQLVDETLPEPWTGLDISYFAPATEFPPGEVVFTIVAESLCYYYCVWYFDFKILVFGHVYNDAVLWSYQSNSLGPGRGKSFMWAAARFLQDNGIASFNGYQVAPGKPWKIEYFGRLPECKVLVAMLSQSYFRSGACIAELITALDQDVPVTWYFVVWHGIRQASITLKTTCNWYGNKL